MTFLSDYSGLKSSVIVNNDFVYCLAQFFPLTSIFDTAEYHSKIHDDKCPKTMGRASPSFFYASSGIDTATFTDFPSSMRTDRGDMVFRADVQRRNSQ